MNVQYIYTLNTDRMNDSHGVKPYKLTTTGYEIHLLLFLAVKIFRKSVKFWPSYSKLNLAHFFGTQCSLIQHTGFALQLCHFRRRFECLHLSCEVFK